MTSLNRRQFAKLATAGATTLAAPTVHSHAASERSELIGHGQHRYRVNKHWGKLDPAQTPVNNCHEMVIDSKGRLLMFNDETKNNVLVYDLSGKLLNTWGTEYPGGHGITLSHENGKDFLFLTDCGWYKKPDGKWGRMSGRVVKTTIDGKVLFSIGHPQTIGAYQPGDRYQPTEVAIAPNGDFYIADGYGSDFFLQYDHNGRFIRKFGGRHNENPEENFKTAHGIVVDTRNGADNPVLVCSSRADCCFKLFTPDGKYLKTIPLPGGNVCRPIIKGDYLYATIILSTEIVDGVDVKRKGFVVILDKDYRVISCPGGVEPSYRDNLLSQIHQDPKRQSFRHPHDVCVDDEENLYVCQWNSGKTYPIKLERVRS